MSEFDFPSGQHVVLVIPDLTRPFDSEVWLPAILEALAGRRVDVVVALGLHRRLTPVELAPIQSICDDHRATLRQHDPDNAQLRQTSVDPPGWFAADLVEADLIVCAGVVEPHQYAGYSGGIKGLSIGCAGRQTINWMHGLEFLRESTTGVGKLDGNRFQQSLWEIASVFEQVWGVFVVPGGGVYSGPVRAAFDAATQDAASRHFFEIAEPVEWLRLVVPPTKATNFYQASRAATYAALVDRPALVQNGWLLVEADCAEGLGEGSGERAFAVAIQRGVDVLLDEMSGTHAIGGGEQRAYVLATVLRSFRMAVITSADLSVLDAVGIPTFVSFQEAKSSLGLSNAGLVVENPFHQVPRLR
jgi:nickel-dependent lactate racemase